MKDCVEYVFIELNARMKGLNNVLLLSFPIHAHKAAVAVSDI